MILCGFQFIIHYFIIASFDFNYHFCLPYGISIRNCILQVYIVLSYLQHCNTVVIKIIYFKYKILIKKQKHFNHCVTIKKYEHPIFRFTISNIISDVGQCNCITVSLSTIFFPPANTTITSKYACVPSFIVMLNDWIPFI